MNKNYEIKIGGFQREIETEMEKLDVETNRVLPSMKELI